MNKTKDVTMLFFLKEMLLTKEYVMLKSEA